MILDQGIFLEYYLDDEYADECEAILDDLDDGAVDGYLTDFHLHGVCAIFNTYFGDDAPDEIQDFVYSIAVADGLTLYRLTLGDKIAICDLQRDTELDFDDATLVHVADVLDRDTIVSLDRHLLHEGEFEYERLHPRDY
ncbi:hypothetical protein [Halomarina pelagica]|uniref:hypothetical protein n=1 Tax=Halomarina pelagica TaxID=2961599 RepID=UPI0020C1F3D8|nr:hypothetical protein [Halomarina sp. BND7]